MEDIAFTTVRTSVDFRAPAHEIVPLFAIVKPR
jgi:hypothetical protein